MSYLSLECRRAWATNFVWICLKFVSLSLPLPFLLSWLPWPWARHKKSRFVHGRSPRPVHGRCTPRPAQKVFFFITRLFDEHYCFSEWAFPGQLRSSGHPNMLWNKITRHQESLFWLNFWTNPKFVKDPQMEPKITGSTFLTLSSISLFDFAFSGVLKRKNFGGHRTPCPVQKTCLLKLPIMLVGTPLL